VLGLGMGGEWNTGATLVAETWPTALRAKAIAVVQSSWAWGYAAAAVVAGLMLQHFQNWRYVFFVGIAPALLLLWIQREVPESEMWENIRRQSSKTPETAAMNSEDVRNAITLLALNFFGLFAWWGLFSWIPPYLSLPVDQGGRGFSQLGATAFLVFLNLVGMFPGYISFGFFADRFGRRPAFFLYLLGAAVCVPIYAMARRPWEILLMGAVVAFFGTGFFSGSGIVGSELFRTRVRARALGITYNGARMLSSIAPYVIGALSLHRGLSGAFVVCAVAFLLAACTSLLLPETRGRELVH
jgi:MFS family permease